MFDVIIPIYRISKPFLTRCLESVFDQTFEDYTVMFVMEHPPTSRLRCESLSGIIRFQLCSSRPCTPLVSGARNQAVSLGSNPYLAFLDGDDWW